MTSPLLAALALALSVAPHPALPPPAAPAASALRVADSLLVAGRFGPCLAIADSLVRATPQRGERAVHVRALTLVAGVRTLTGQPELGEVAAREAMESALADRDSAIARRALRWLAFSHLQRGHLAVSTPLYQRLLALCEPHGEWQDVGYAHMGIAYAALLEGRFPEARRGYERALAAMRRAGDPRGERQVEIGLARVLDALGDFDGERALERRVLEDATRAGDWFTEVQALNNLGAIELTVGDPALALAHWRRALALRPGTPSPASIATERTNEALALLMLGRLDEAAAGLDSLADGCAAAGLRTEATEARVRLGEVRRDQGRLDESWAAYRPELAGLDSVPEESRQSVVVGAAATLRVMGRLTAADSLLRRELAQARVAPLARAGLEGALAEIALELGRPREALARAQRAAGTTARLGERSLRLQALVTASRAWRALGRADSARVMLEMAAGVWEAERRAPSDPEWRERRGATGARIFAALAVLVLDTAADRPHAARAAFDVLQRYKARTLLERMAGPGRDLAGGVRPPTTLDEVMRTLRPGEVLLDFFVGPDSALVFAVDRAGVSVARLASGPRLATRGRVLRDLYADRRGGVLLDDVRRRAASALGETLLGGVAARVRGARAVILAPDGGLNLMPLEALVVPGETRALGACHATWRVPSATLLVTLRARPVVGRGHGVLALAGTRDAAGRLLLGAAREVRALGARFEAVDVRVIAGGADARRAIGAMPGCDVLHIAAHTALDDQRPWNSGVCLGADPRTDWLRAGAIAGTPLAARLAVLAGCASAGGRALSGEGVQGLAAAFLSAGVPAVVATLWPVDDRAAGDFSEAFYDRLGHGEPAAVALSGAQADLSRRPGLRPADWAGFVLVGDGATRVRLVERPKPWWILALVLGLIAVLVTSGRALGARRRARHGGL